MTEHAHKQCILDLAFSVSSERRGEILDRECGGDASLRAELEDLLLTADLSKNASETPTMAADNSTPADSLGQGEMDPDLWTGSRRF